MAFERRKLEIAAGIDGIIVGYSDRRIDGATKLRLRHSDGVISALVATPDGVSELTFGHVEAAMSALMKKWSTVIMARTQGASSIALGELPIEHI